MKIISNCPLCEEHGLHVIEDSNIDKVMQCLNCGYVSSNKFIGTKKDNEEYQKLTDEMKEWCIENDNRLWLPTMLTLPVGTLYPKNIDNLVNHQVEMKWAWSPMVDIPEEERHNYPDDKGGFYNRRFDTDNVIIYDNFLDAMVEIRKIIKENKPEPTKLKLPKLKKL